ncbi:MAG: HD domain-containing protein [Clostridiales bacterium]|nr:HD domain-containing protein [Clostridiales bacterium]
MRDCLLGYPLSLASDWDISSPAPEVEVVSAAKQCGMEVVSVFKNTGTVKLKDEAGAKYEFTRFRSDKYVRGVHTPTEITFTDDIEVDARRRDFCANAVYYDIRADKFVDPLGGIADIENKILRTVAPARKVFGEDGLRLMRLARFAAELGFSPDDECTAGAKEHCALIRDIAPERVYAELNAILLSDLKHGIKDALYHGLKVLEKTGVLKEILPELALGKGMEQPKAFHDHDVLEHSLRCVRYAPPEIRFAALLHDVGKPFCMVRDGNYHAHPEEGARIAAEILTRLKAPKKLIDETCRLVALHMRDYNYLMRETKVRREIVENYPLLDKLFALKQADFSACKDDLTPAPVVTKWQNIYTEMRKEGAPFTLRQLAVSGDDLLALGVPPYEVGTTLNELLLYCALDGTRNNRDALLKRLKKQLEKHA